MWANTVADEFVVSEDGLLYQVVQLHGDENYLQQLYVPEVSRDELLDEAHSGPLLSHTGISKMVIKTQCYYYWPGMKQDIMWGYHSCMVCASRQGQHRSGIVPLTPILPMVKPIERVMMDILALSMTHHGDKYLLVIVDTLIKFCWAFPMLNQEAKTVISAFLTVWHSKPQCMF